jgi:hypothetical protein
MTVRTRWHILERSGTSLHELVRARGGASNDNCSNNGATCEIGFVLLFRLSAWGKLVPSGAFSCIAVGSFRTFRSREVEESPGLLRSHSSLRDAPGRSAAQSRGFPSAPFGFVPHISLSPHLSAHLCLWALKHARALRSAPSPTGGLCANWYRCAHNDPRCAQNSHEIILDCRKCFCALGRSTAHESAPCADRAAFARGTIYVTLPRPGTSTGAEPILQGRSVPLPPRPLRRT